jgi:hypothetical protein
MPGRTETAGRGRTIGSLLAAGAVGALVLAGASACGSSTTTASSSDTSQVPVATASSASPTTGASGAASPGAASSPSAGATTPTSAATAPAASASASAGATGSNHPMIPGPGGVVLTPKAQLTTVPSGKLVQFTSAQHSEDGRTLYLGIESQGGACGQYDVVVQQTGSSVSVGLVQLPSGGRVCPMYVTHMLVTAKLSAPLERRRVIDLANGQVVSSSQIS